MFTVTKSEWDAVVVDVEPSLAISEVATVEVVVTVWVVGLSLSTPVHPFLFNSCCASYVEPAGTHKY